MTDFIVVGIDGSGSRSWRTSSGMNSYVYRFVRDVRSPNTLKRYWNGPDDTFGFGTGAITDAAFRALVGILEAHDVVQVNRSTWRGRPTEQIVYENGLTDAYKIALVGHSRGAHAVIQIARRLEAFGVPVQFLGLYDAVDRTIGGSSMIRNARVIAHAMRSDGAQSRGSFGHTGIDSEDSVVHRRSFDTSHGGVGGDAVYLPSETAASWPDYSCAIDDVRGGVLRMRGEDPTERCRTESHAANEYVRSYARQAGVPFRG